MVVHLGSTYVGNLQTNWGDIHMKRVVVGRGRTKVVVVAWGAWGDMVARDMRECNATG